MTRAQHNTQHTPGPWQAIGERGAYVRDADGNPIAAIQPRAETEPNARLIAAAPDLLAALRDQERIVEYVRKRLRAYATNDNALAADLQWLDRETAPSRAAIAKAEGR